MLRQDERGFTLVELVISMGMFSLVMIAILVFMTSGSKSYGYSNGELNMQMESQMLIGQVRDMVYDSNYAEYQPSKQALILYKLSVPPRETEPVTEKVITRAKISNIVKKRVIYWRNEKLYYQEVKPPQPTAVPGATPGATLPPAVPTDDAPTYPTDAEHLLCDFVKTFDVSVTKKTGDVRFQAKLKNNVNNHYDLDEKISMRSSWLEFDHEGRTDYY